MKSRALAVLLFAAACGTLIAPEARRYNARIELNRVEALLRTAQVDEISVRKNAALSIARDRLTALLPRLPNDVRPRYFLGVALQLQGEPLLALDAFRSSLSVQERPVVDLAMSRSLQALGEPEGAAALAVRAIWLSPWLRWQIREPARSAVDAQIRELERELRAGDEKAVPELPKLVSRNGNR